MTDKEETTKDNLLTKGMKDEIAKRVEHIFENPDYYFSLMDGSFLDDSKDSKINLGFTILSLWSRCNLLEEKMNEEMDRIYKMMWRIALVLFIIAVMAIFGTLFT